MNKRLEKGITLIILIFTIIILLILAGITIAALGGENGLVSKAKKGIEQYSISQQKEKLEMAIESLRIDEEGKGENLTKEKLPKINNNEIDVRSTEKFPVEVICGNYKFYVDDNFNVTYVGEADGTIVTYTTQPEGYTNQDKIKILIKAINPKGINKIIYPDGDELLSQGNTEVGVDYEVTKNETYTFKILDNTGKEELKDIVIDQIDKLPPIDFTPQVEQEGGTIRIIENGEDAEATEESTKSGIDYYEYYVIDSNSKTTKYDKNQINNLTLGTYQVYVIAYDKAGNKKQSNTIEIKISIKLKEISTRYDSNLAIDDDENLWTWGWNGAGQLGDGTTGAYSSKLINISNRIKYKKIASGTDHALAIDKEGKLWTWGFNNYGQLGNGTTSDSAVPIKIKEDTKFKEISAGEDHCLAIDEDGRLWTWGNMQYEKLGNIVNSVPIRIKEDIKFKKISAGIHCSFAIDEDGKLWSWGLNQYGKLGNGTKNHSDVPIKIKEDIKFKEISAGYNHCLAIDEDGKLWTWGWNSYGRLGDGTTNDSAVPIKIKEDTKFKEVSAGGSHSLAIDEDGKLWAWGHNSNGQLGNGTTSDSAVPIKIKEDIEFKEVSAGGSHSLAIDKDGNGYAWGSNAYGACGKNINISIKIPTQI